MKWEDQLAVNRAKLDGLSNDKKIAASAHIGNTSRVTGSVHIGSHTTIENCIVRGPVIVGDNCTLKDAYVGPYTRLGNGVKMVATEIENSVVQDGASICDLKDRVQNSIIGARVQIARIQTDPACYQFCVGADAQIEIP